MVHMSRDFTFNVMPGERPFNAPRAGRAIGRCSERRRFRRFQELGAGSVWIGWTEWRIIEA